MKNILLPFLGWPNPPNKPTFSTEGRILYINWELPVYLGGLNDSLIYFEAHNFNSIYNSKYNLIMMR